MNYGKLENASLQILSQKAAGNLSFIVLSPFSIATNLLVALTIVYSKSLHNKSHFVILSHSIAEAINAFTYLGSGLIRYFGYYYGVPDTSSQLMCTLKQTPISIMGDVVQKITIALAVDRFLCVTKPIFYKTRRTLTYITALNTICWSYAVVKNLIAFVGDDREAMVAACFQSTAYHPTFLSYVAIETDAIVVVNAALYLMAGLIMWRRYKTTKFSGESQRSEWRRRMDLDVFFAMVAIGVIYLINCGAVAVVNSITATYNFVEFAILVSPVRNGFYFASSISHFFVYLWFNRLFRKAFSNVVLRKDDNTVHPLG